MSHITNGFVLAALSLLLAPSAQARPRVWLGDRYLGQAPALRPGLHAGPDLQVGGQVYRAEWRTAGDPALPALPVRSELVVVTTRELATGSQRLPDFLAARRSEGFQVVLATEDDWDQGEGDRATRIRAWLQARYADAPGAFLLLVGDPDPRYGDIPMREVHPLISIVDWYSQDPWLMAELDPIPTDALYGDLTGNWDLDGDGLYGEWPDDDGAGGVDFGPELYVGRLPVYGGDVAALDALLDRVLAWDHDPDPSWRGHVLLPGALFGLEGESAPGGGFYESHDDGACILDGIWRSLPSPWSEGARRLYEDEGLLTSPYPHDGPLSRDTVVEQWNLGNGVVVWAGHGSSTGVYRTVWLEDDGDGEAQDAECSFPPFLESPDARDLQEAPGAFTFHISCDNGYPEEPENLGTALLSGGAIGTVTASRPSFGFTAEFGETWEPRADLGGGETLAWYHAHGLVAGLPAGQALAEAKASMTGDGWEEVYGWDYTCITWAGGVEFHLYGDPTRSLGTCASDGDCDDGSPCNGVESCSGGFCARTAAVDCSSLDDTCTRGACDDATGACVSEPRLDGTACDDGAWCTEVDACEAGACVGQERDCGSREGWEASCDETADACAWSELPPEEEGGGCSTAPGRGSLWGWLLLALGVGRRRK